MVVRCAAIGTITRIVRLRPEPVNPNPDATAAYAQLLARFEADLAGA